MNPYKYASMRCVNASMRGLLLFMEVPCEHHLYKNVLSTMGDPKLIGEHN